MECGKRQTTLTAKAWANKIVKLQRERKITVDKMTALIPEIKPLNKAQIKENDSHVHSHFEKLRNLRKINFVRILLYHMRF